MPMRSIFWPRAARPRPPGSVLTPHPGEAARLLDISTDAVQADRMAALHALTVRHPGAVIVLKGAGTLIGQLQQHAPSPVPAICERGNPAMAAAGMGDVLTGALPASWRNVASRGSPRAPASWRMRWRVMTWRVTASAAFWRWNWPRRSIAG